MKISPVVLERVDAGWAWLDENLPDWREVINPKTIDMTWEESCIIGQYQFHKYGDTSFMRAMHAYFGDNDERAIALGFLDSNFNYTELNAAWQQKFEEMSRNDKNNKEAQG